MRRNLDLSGPLLLSEGVSAAVAPLLDDRATDGAAGAGAGGSSSCRPSWTRRSRPPPPEQAATYRRLLREAVPAELLSDARLEELLDPASYLGQAAEISRRILAAYPDFAAAQPPGVTEPPPTESENGASRG